jgi:hypothetical protein
MNFAAVLAQLNDLPSAFTRPGPPYTWLAASLAVSDALSTETCDDTVAQTLTFANAQDGWIDVWGLLFNMPRNQNEANSLYAARIQETVLAWVGTLPALQAWIALFAPGGSIAENISGLGYVITLPAAMSQTQVQNFLQSLNRIRPAGVPFSVNVAAGGLFAGTANFTGGGGGGVMGDYLSAATSSLALGISPTTQNSVPLLPTTLLVDPTINPSLTPAVP